MQPMPSTHIADDFPQDIWNEYLTRASTLSESSAVQPQQHSVEMSKAKLDKLLAWRPTEIADYDFEPDITIPLNAQEWRAYIKSEFGKRIDIPEGYVDGSAAEISVKLKCKKTDTCQYTQHLIEINLLSMGNVDKRVLASWRGKAVALDALEVLLVPVARIEADRVIVDCFVQVGYVQDRSWPGYILIGANDFVRNQLNSALPKPAISIPLDLPEALDAGNIEALAIRIDGCFYPADIEIDQKILIDVAFR